MKDLKAAGTINESAEDIVADENGQIEEE